MSWAALITGGVSLATSGASFISGQNQKNQSRFAGMTDPGFVGNQNLQDNANILKNRFSNYRLPGYTKALESINRGAEMGYRSITQGAASSGDILEGATNIAYGTQQSQNQLSLQESQGEEAALKDFLTANAIAGEEMEKANQWERDQYLRARQDQANLYNAGLVNQNNALRGIGSTVGQFGSYAVNNNLFGGSPMSDTASGSISTVLPGANVYGNISEVSGVKPNLTNNNIYIPKKLT